jgi:hypothetical protein
MSANYVQKINGNYIAAAQVVPNSELANMLSGIKDGAFKVADPLNPSADPPDLRPDVNDPSEKVIYLTRDPNATVRDPYYEWIYSVDEGAQEATWKCIGTTSMDLEDYKKVQTAVPDPSVPASGSTTSLTFIDTITQDTQGVITPTKKTVPDATETQKGVVQLGSNTTQTEAAQAVSSTAGKTYAIQKDSSGKLVVNVPWTDAGAGLTFDPAHPYNSGNNPAATVESVTARIGALDAEETSTDGTNVQVKVTETDGVITEVSIATDNTENNGNKVSTWQGTPDNTHYPSEKLVKDTIDTVAGTANTAVQSVKINNGTELKNGTNVNIPLASTTADGAMSSTDKGKLDNIASGAEVNQNAYSNVKVGSTTIAASAKTDTVELAAGTHVTLTPDSTNKKVTIATDLSSQAASSGGTAESLVTTGEKYTWNSKQDALDAQTAYTSKGSATKVPQITTNTYGQVTGITEVEITGVTPAAHTHGNITNAGTLQTTGVAIANGDAIVVTDSSDSGKVAKTTATFDGSTTTKALTQKGTFETFYQKPSGGIAKSDLASGVQTSLEKADSAVQDVTLNSTSLVSNNVAVIPIATSGTPETTGSSGTAGTPGDYGVVQLELITI